MITPGEHKERSKKLRKELDGFPDERCKEYKFVEYVIELGTKNFFLKDGDEQDFLTDASLGKMEAFRRAKRMMNYGLKANGTGVLGHVKTVRYVSNWRKAKEYWKELNKIDQDIKSS